LSLLSKQKIDKSLNVFQKQIQNLQMVVAIVNPFLSIFCPYFLSLTKTNIFNREVRKKVGVKKLK
jgi:hypothetical protein